MVTTIVAGRTGMTGWSLPGAKSFSISVIALSRAVGPRAGAIGRDYVDSPRWGRMCSTEASLVFEGTALAMSAMEWIAGVLVRRADVSSGSVAVSHLRVLERPLYVPT